MTQHTVLRRVGHRPRLLSFVTLLLAAFVALALSVSAMSGAPVSEDRRSAPEDTPGRVNVLATADETAAPPRYVTSVSANGRYFRDQAGNPILVKGDSPWAILQDASTTSMDSYLETRARQGFNVVLCSLLGNTTNGGPNNNGATYDGVLPFVGGDPTRLNETYWDRVDHFIAKAASLGITVMAYPIDGWVGTAEHSGLARNWSAATADAYGAAVGTRLRNHPNIIWSVGGDYITDATDDARMWAVQTGIARAGADRLTTIQFEPNQYSTEFAFWDEKVDFNFVYSYARSYLIVERAYAATNPNGAHVPALMSEAHYEAYEAGWRVDDLYLRQMAAWSLTSGSPGEFYGSEDVWDTNPTASALSTRAVAQLSAMRGAFESLAGWHQLVPDIHSTFITAGRGTKADSSSGEYTGGDTYVTGAKTPDGRLAVIYLPAATREITVDTTQLVAGYSARWVDPTNGASTPAAPGTRFSKSGANAAGGPDWLLVLEATVNKKPVAGDDALILFEDTTGSVRVLDNDTDADGGALRVTARTHGRHGWVWCTMAGLCSYRPERNFWGRDSFTYTVGDGQGGTAIGTVDVAVRGVADPPGPARIGRAWSGPAGGLRTIICQWWPPLTNGGAPVTSYKVTALGLSAGGRIASRVTRTVDDSWRRLSIGLPRGRYQCVAAATNRAGTGPLSPRSNIVYAR